MREFLICSHINPSLTDQNTSNFLTEKWFVNIDVQLETIFGKDFNSYVLCFFIKKHFNTTQILFQNIPSLQE